MRRVGLLGGTFDPIHIGHLMAARVTHQALGLSEVRFLPSHLPPHREEPPAASGYHRFAMAALATAPEPAWLCSDLELTREALSYTFDTLRSLHEEGLSPSQIFFIIGADAFAEIESWHRFPDVLDAAHFAVVQRPGTAVAALATRLPQLAERMLRAESLRDDMSPRLLLLAAATPEISSTEIRRRTRYGEPIDGLVPAAVHDYIDRHALYREVRDEGAVTVRSLEGRLHGKD